MSEAGLKIAEADGIVEVTIDRPPVNALARSTYLEIAQVFSSFRDRPDVRVVILTGAGERAFCAGRDIKDLGVERAEGPIANVGDPYHLDPRGVLGGAALCRAGDLRGQCCGYRRWPRAWWR